MPKIKKVLMSQIIRNLAPGGLIVVGILLAAAMFPARSSYAKGEQSPFLDAVATPVPGGPGYIMIAPGSFHADAGSDDYSIDFLNRYVTQGTGIVDLYAPVQLPHGARITQLTYYSYDITTFYTYADLVRSSPADYGTQFDSVYSAWSAGSSGNQTIVDSTPGAVDAEVVDNSRYSYVVHVYFSGGSGMRAYGVRIDYEYGSFLPLALKDAAP